MVGGPPGTNFSAATILWAYGPNGYFTPTSGVVGACEGLWAYFPTPVSVSLDQTAVGPTATCPLQEGWNLLGNPFAGAAQLPSGTVAYHWNNNRGGYDVVNTIPVGGSVWVYTALPRTIVLTYVPSSPPVAATLTLDSVVPGPFTVHVGDNVRLNLPSGTPYVATTDPTYLHLDSAGLTGDLTCVGDPGCNVSLVTRFWIWHAVAPGMTTITVTCQTPTSKTPCTVPNGSIAINIVP